MAERVTPEPADTSSEIDRLRAALERRERQLIEAMTDQTTGLRQRGMFYGAIERELVAACTAERWGAVERAPDAAAAIAAIGDVQANMDPAASAILFADVGYLSYVNRGGHEAGDALLQHIGNAARMLGSPPVELPEHEPRIVSAVFFRHGGDELTAIIRGGAANAARTAREFGEAVGAARVPSLDQRGLRPRVDIGVAQLAEGVDALRLLLERSIDVPVGDRLRRYATLLVAIADRRASIQKGVERVALLVRLRREQPELYDEVVPSLRKGAYEISDREVDQFVEMQASGTDLAPLIQTLIRDRVHLAFQEAQAEREREYEVVCEVADRAAAAS